MKEAVLLLGTVILALTLMIALRPDTHMYLAAVALPPDQYCHVAYYTLPVDSAQLAAADCIKTKP